MARMNRMLLLIILLLLLVFALPTWPDSAGWSYDPSGLLGLLLSVLFVFLLADRRGGLLRR